MQEGGSSLAAISVKGRPAPIAGAAQGRISGNFLVLGGCLVAIDHTLRHETASLHSRPSARHWICSATDQCLRVLVRTGSMVRTRAARRGLCPARRWVLVGQIVVSLPLASGLGSQLARRLAA
jgi:hypothetical protein